MSILSPSSVCTELGSQGMLLDEWTLFKILKPFTRHLGSYLGLEWRALCVQLLRLRWNASTRDADAVY